MEAVRLKLGSRRWRRTAPSGTARADVEAIIRFGREHVSRDLHDVIPRDCFVPNVARQLLGLLLNVVGSVVAWGLLAASPFGFFLPALWFLCGTCSWGLMVIAHECGHGSFSRSRRLNHFVGHVTMTPFLYPFHSWRLLHNHHHANTNSIEKDIDWRPLPVAVYLRLPMLRRLGYRLMRTWLWWAATLHQLVTQAFNLGHVAFQGARRQRDVRFSIAVVAVYSSLFFPLMISWLGPWGLVKYWLMPWLVAYGWFSLVTLMHHTHPAVPFLEKKHWSRNSSNLCLTVYCRFPRWMELFGHDINVHISHHVAPSIPYFNLRTAHRALAEHFPHYVREVRFGWRELLLRLRHCQLYDRKNKLYLPFFAARSESFLPPWRTGQEGSKEVHRGKPTASV